MSIAEFTKTLKNRSSSSILDRLVSSSVSAYGDRSKYLKAASILNEDATAFRILGKKQGLTRLIVTEDSLAELLSSFGIVFGSEKDAINLYLDYLTTHEAGYKNKHFEFYNDTGDRVTSTNRNTPLGEYIPSIDKPIIAVRGLNFSHDHTLTHIVRFLKYAGAGSLTGLSEIDAKKAVGELFERGHILATTTGRQLASIGGISEEKDILDKIVQLSIDLDIASSSLSNQKYSKILANINKDFTDKRMYMNLEFQSIRNDTGIGNQDSADITRGIRAISTLRKLIDNVAISRGKLISSPIATKSEVAAKVFLDLILKIEKYEKQIISVLSNYAEIGNAAKYVADLKSSKSIRQHTADSIVSSIKNTKQINTKVSHKNVKVSESRSSKSKKTDLGKQVLPLVTARKNELDNLLKVFGKLSRPIRANIEQSTASLEAILRNRLYPQIKKNMGTGNAKNVLNFRTGRLAKSASIDHVTTSRAGMVSVFYNYMRNPYGTFSEGGQQQYPRTRDPKLLISKSIREIGASMMQNRMRAVLV